MDIKFTTKRGWGGNNAAFPFGIEWGKGFMMAPRAVTGVDIV